MKRLLAIASGLALLCACAQNHGSEPKYKIGDFASVDTALTSYEDFSLYAESLDGFIQDDSLAAKADPLLLKALKDCNIPVAPKEEIEARAEVFHHAKVLMDSIIVLDTHCDFPEVKYYHPERGYSIAESQSRRQVSLEKMRQGHMSAEYMVIWMDPFGDNQFDPKGIAAAPAALWDFIDKMESHFADHYDLCGLARSREDAAQLKAEGKKALFYALENSYWIGDNLANIAKLADKGVTYVSLTHWGDNIVCHSCSGSADPSLGLTEYGRKVVEEMNRQGIIVDLSHTSYGTWQDVLAASKAPVVFSHSGAAAVYQNVRNVDDETLLKLKANGGVIQVYIVGSFMAPRGERDKVGLKDMVEHICHIVDLIGVDHVGVGLDFDGGGGGVGFNGANDAINLTVALIEKGFSDEDIAKIWGGNWFRVLDEVQRVGRELRGEE